MRRSAAIRPLIRRRWPVSLPKICVLLKLQLDGEAWSAVLDDLAKALVYLDVLSLEKLEALARD